MDASLWGNAGLSPTLLDRFGDYLAPLLGWGLSRPSLEVLTVEHIVTQPVETVADITCDVCCQSTRVEGYGLQFGTLQAHWGYGSKHDGERYEVHLCEPCFFRTLSALRRERMVNTLFDEEPNTTENEFGLVRRGEFWGDD